MGAVAGKASTVSGIAAVVAGLGFVGGLATGDIEASAVVVLLVLAAAGVAVARWRGFRIGPSWLPGALGGLVLVLGATAVSSVAGGFDSLFSLGTLIWTVAGLLPLVPARFLSLPAASAPATSDRPASASAADASPSAGAGVPATAPPSPTAATRPLIYRAVRPVTYRLVLVGAIVCFVSLFFPWLGSERTVNMTIETRGNVTVHKDQYGQTLWKDDNTYHTPNYTTSESGGASGFEMANPFIVLLVLGYIAAGFVGLGVTLPDLLCRYGPPAGLGLLALAALGSLIEPGLGVGTLLFVAGAGLAAWGGWLTYAPALLLPKSGPT